MINCSLSISLCYQWQDTSRPIVLWHHTHSKDKLCPDIVSSVWRCIPKVSARIPVDVHYLLKRINNIHLPPAQVYILWRVPHIRYNCWNPSQMIVSEMYMPQQHNRSSFLAKYLRKRYTSRDPNWLFRPSVRTLVRATFPERLVGKYLNLEKTLHRFQNSSWTQTSLSPVSDINSYI